MHKFLMPSCTAKLRIIQFSFVVETNKKKINKPKKKNTKKRKQNKKQTNKPKKKKKTYYMSHEEFRNKQVRVIFLVLSFSGKHI